jgi:hypothetical protein
MDTHLHCTDPTFIEKLAEKIGLSIAQSLSATLSKFSENIDNKLSQRIDAQAVEIFTLHQKIENLEKHVKQLEDANGQLVDRLNAQQLTTNNLQASSDDLDQYSRNCNLLIHGLPSTSSPGQPEPNLIPSLVSSLNHHLGTRICENDIDVAHRLQRATNNPSQGNNVIKPNPVIIQFTSRKIRNLLLSKRKLLKSTGITLTEHLTPKRASLLHKCTLLAKEKRIEAAWSDNGKVLIKTLQNRTILVLSDSDLTSL